jgi:hypothetical protein
MVDIHEWRVNIKFCFKLGKTFTGTDEMMKNVYGDQCLSHTHCYEWFKRFKRMVSSQYMMSRVWGGPQRHVTTLMLHKFIKSLILIVV